MSHGRRGEERRERHTTICAKERGSNQPRTLMKCDRTAHPELFFTSTRVQMYKDVSASPLLRRTPCYISTANLSHTAKNICFDAQIRRVIEAFLSKSFVFRQVIEIVISFGSTSCLFSCNSRAFPASTLAKPLLLLKDALAPKTHLTTPPL